MAALHYIPKLIDKSRVSQKIIERQTQVGRKKNMLSRSDQSPPPFPPPLPPPPAFIWVNIILVGDSNLG